MNFGCGGLASPFPWYLVGRAVRVYVRVVVIVLLLVLGTRLGIDPVVSLGWGTVAWLLLGRLGDATGGCANAGRRAR